MAFAEQTLILTLTLFFISAHIISLTSADASPAIPILHAQTEVQEEPNASKDAVNVIVKLMQTIENKINDFNASLKKRKDDPAASHGTLECVAECDEVFAAAIDAINNTVVSLESRNFFKATFDISAVSTDVETCNDCFVEMVGGDMEVKKLAESVHSITEEAFQALQTATD